MPVSAAKNSIFHCMLRALSQLSDESDCDTSFDYNQLKWIEQVELVDKTRDKLLY